MATSLHLLVAPVHVASARSSSLGFSQTHLEFSQDAGDCGPVTLSDCTLHCHISGNAQ